MIYIFKATSFNFDSVLESLSSDPAKDLPIVQEKKRSTLPATHQIRL